MRPSSWGSLQSLEVGGAPRVLQNHLTVENRRPATDAGRGGNYAGIVAVSRVGAYRTAFKHEHGAVAVMLDFVNPVITSGRLFDESWKLWLDKAKAGNARHARLMTSCQVSL